MSGKVQNKVLYLALVIASLSLVLSGFSLVLLYVKDNGWKTELVARLADLEEEHDYLLQTEEELLLKPKSSRSGSKPELCQLLPDPGPCTSQVNRWYYLPREGDCLEFPWGGCQGNDNNFLSLDQCRSACLVAAEKPRPPHLASSAPVQAAELHPLLPAAAVEPFDFSACLHPPDSGPCSNRITRYYHESGACKRFQYGGCAGNTNNFFTRGECARKCVQTGDEAGESPRDAREEAEDQRMREGGARENVIDICSLPEDKGSCTDKYQRFMWDSRMKMCVRFDWGGCGGNSNNFVSMEKCRNRCDI